MVAASRNDIVLDLQPFIRHCARACYGRYPLPCVQDVGDLCQTVNVRLLTYLAEHPDTPRVALESKVRRILQDCMRVNHRLGFSGREDRSLPDVLSIGGQDGG